MEAKYFGPRLKELRKCTGLSQKALAEKAGIAQSSVAGLEQGLYDPTWTSVLALATALGVDCRAFLERPLDTEPPAVGRPAKVAASGDEKKAAKRKKAKK